MADFKTVQPNDPPWLVEAFKLLGLTEGKGAANNPEVLALYAEAGFSGIKADSVAWCAAFKGAMLRRAGYRASGSLAARSYLDYGEVIEPDDAKRGDTAIFKRGTASWQGHVGDLLKIDANTVWVIGGNQSLKGTDGAVTITALPRTSLLGVRRPTAADKLAAGTVVTPAKPRKAATPPSPAPVNASLVAAVQRALIDKGYHEVGEPDGKAGTKILPHEVPTLPAPPFGAGGRKHSRAKCQSCFSADWMRSMPQSDPMCPHHHQKASHYGLVRTETVMAVSGSQRGGVAKPIGASPRRMRTDAEGMQNNRLLIVIDAYVADAQALSTTLDSLVLQNASMYTVDIILLVSYQTSLNDMVYLDRLHGIENYKPLSISINRSSDDVTDPGRRLRPVESAAHEFVLFLNQGDQLGRAFIDKACLILEAERVVSWVDPKHSGKSARGLSESQGPYATISSFLIGPRYSSGFVYRRQDLIRVAAAVRWPGQHNLLLDLILQTNLLGRGRFPIRTPEIECVHGGNFPVSGLQLKQYAALMAVALRSTGIRALLLWRGLNAARRRVGFDRGKVRRLDPRWLLDRLAARVFRRVGRGDRFVAADPALIMKLLISPQRFKQHVLDAKSSLTVADIRSDFVRKPKLPVQQRDEAPLGSGIVFAHTNWTVGGAERVLMTWMASARGVVGEKIFEVTERENWISDHPDTGFILTDPVVRRQFAELGDGQFSLETLTPSPLGRIKLLLELVGRARPRLLFISGNSYAYSALPALKARFPGLVVVDILHNEWGSDFDWFNIAAEYDQYIDRRIVISDHWRRVLVEKYRTPFAKVMLVENGVSLDAYLPDEEARQRLRTEARYEADDRVICFVGRLHEQKRPEVFFELARLFRDSPEYKFVVAGDGPLRAGLLERYADLDKLRYLGAIDTVADLLQIADLAVFCSEFEGYPVASLEAAAMNVAVVAPDIVGFREQLNDGSFGILYEPSQDAMADAQVIRNCIVGDWERLQTLGRNGRDFVNRRHGLQQISQRQQSVLKELLSSEPSPTPSLIKRRKRLYLHVGMPKTGSSSIQWFLNNNRLMLQDQGLLYPASQLSGDAHYPVSWLCVPEQRRWFDDAAKWFEAIETYRPIVRQFVRDLSTSPYDSITLSSESFFAADPKRVAELFEAHDVRTIIYMRRQDSYLEAHLNQNTKMRGLFLDKHERVHLLQTQLDYARWLSRWEASLGKSSVDVVPFEKHWFPAGLERGYIELLGLEWDERFFTSARNGRMTRDGLEFLVRLNALGRLDRQGYLEAVRLLQPFADDNPDPPAYRNAYSPQQRRAFLEQFRDSNALVARNYLGLEGPLFSMDFDDDTWRPYPGLSAEAATAIAQHLAIAGIDEAPLAEVIASLEKSP